MRSSRVTEDEICSAIRAGDCAALEEVEAVCLRLTGALTSLELAQKRTLRLLTSI